jgi:predicted ATPase
MPPTDETGRSPANTARPRWSEVLRALREARGVTLDGWGARLGVSRTTVQRWERGERAPDPGAETAILAYCRDTGLFRSYDHGPLAGLSLTPALLQQVFTEARWRVRDAPAGAVAPSAPPPVEQVDRVHAGQPPVRLSNLPSPLTSFIGRREELAALRRVQGGSRLLTLTGVGGGGKTRLALQLADELLWAYPDGICFVELASLGDPALIPDAASAALGLQTSGERPAVTVLQEQLTQRHLLLVLDNCEHLLPYCAELVETLLRACPQLEVVATSREALGIAGETVWRVQPLSSADATRLFVDRARLHQPEIELSPADEATIEQICARLDGIPLAIELAAVRVRALSVEQIAARLHDRFQLLTSGSRTALPRQQTLRATLAWSYDLLTDDEQALLRRLAVFAGGWTLEAAEAIGRSGNREPAVLDLLGSLVDKSLVAVQHREGAVRYGLLETVRQFAGEQLETAGETAVIRDRHRDWCLDLSEQAEAVLHGPGEGERFARLEEEHDNLRAALAWSIAQADGQGAVALRLVAALARFWEVRGHMSEGRQWLTQALAAGGAAPADVRAKALERAWWLSYMQGDYAAARGFNEQSLALYRTLGDARGIARAHSQMAGIALRCGDQAEARALMEQSLALHTALGDTWGTAAAQIGLGLLALRQGDYTVARPCLEAGLALHRQLGNKEGMANALDYLANVAGEQGDIEQETALLAEALMLFRELGNKGGVALVLGDLGMQAWLQGEHTRAVALLDESLALYRERAERRGTSRLLAWQSLLALHRRDYVRAAALCRESLTLAHELGDRWASGHYLPVLAAAVFGLDQRERAVQLLSTATARREQLATPLPRAIRPVHDATLAALRSALGEQAFAAGWAAGQALSSDDAIEAALTEPN